MNSMQSGILRQAARAIYRRCDLRLGRHAAVVFIGRHARVIGVNHKGEGRISDRTIHAEEDAINKALKLNVNLSEATLFVCRIGGANKQWKNSKPCKGCDQLIKRYGIRKVVYT